jgi:N-alpha-acetyl-L-2,4-diaminobutyrate deacetylase
MARITTSVDLDKPGRQAGNINIPNSSNTSGWGTLQVPLVVVNGGPGPTMLLTGGNHGDEYEGPVALLKLIRELDAGSLAGRVIIMPALNLPALLAGQRLSPIDGKNMNRVFPGERRGTVTSLIAYFVQNELLPRTDILVDIHSGGRSMYFAPTTVVHDLPDADLMAKSLAAARAFGAPFGLVLEELDAEGMLDTAIEEMGKLFVSTELGGAATLSPRTVGIADRGVRNLLVHFGLVDGQISTPPTPTRLMEVPDGSFYLAAEEGGLYEPLVEVGDAVRRGQAIGQLHDPERPLEPAAVKLAAQDGVLICRHGQGRAYRGDTLAVIARDYQLSA